MTGILVEHGRDISGTTAQRPTNASVGARFFDTTLGVQLVWNGTVWLPVPGVVPVVIATDAVILTAADAGKIVVMNAAASKVVSLPATQAGLTFTLVHQVATSSGVGHSLSPVAADLIRGNGITPADNKDIICTQATSRIGDAITVVGDGVDGWYIASLTGTWAREG